MTQLPKFTWDVDPVFLRVPRELVIGGLVLFTAVSLIIGLRKKAGDQLLTALIFGALAALAYKFLGDEFELRYYSALFLGVFLGGYSLLKWQITRGGGRAEDAGDFIVYGVLGVLVGARLGHVLFYDLAKAVEDPLWVFKIWTGGLASHGAVIGLITAMWLYCKRRGVPFLEGADRFAFSAALGATLVRLGNLFNSEIIGREVPGHTWGMWLKRHDNQETYRYPTQFYEIALGLGVLGALFLIDRRLGREKRPRGVMIASFFALYFPGRFVIEFYKAYEGLDPKSSPLTMGQYLSLPGMFLGFYGLYWAFKHRLPVAWPNPYADSLPAADDDEEVQVTRRRKKKSKGGKKKRKQKLSPAPVEEAKESEEESSEAEADHDDSDDRLESARPSAEALEKQKDEAPADEDDQADDEDQDDEEDEPATTRKPAASGDPDVDDEFDADGKLRRNR